MPPRPCDPVDQHASAWISVAKLAQRLRRRSPCDARVVSAPVEAQRVDGLPGGPSPPASRCGLPTAASYCSAVIDAAAEAGRRRLSRVAVDDGRSTVATTMRSAGAEHGQPGGERPARQRRAVGAEQDDRGHRPSLSAVVSGGRPRARRSRRARGSTVSAGFDGRSKTTSVTPSDS